MIENQALQSKSDDKRDRELIRQLRRDLDEQKRRSTQLQSETNDLRRERDQLKLEKNEQFIQFTREIEEVQGAKRQLKSDLERQDFKFKNTSEEIQKLQLKCERKQAELHKILSEKNAHENILKARDSMVESLTKQTTSLKEDLRARELEN